MEDKNKKLHTHQHEHHDHECECGCEHDHEEFEDIEDLICDLDPNKICDNCMKCLNTFNTDGKGYVSIGIDSVDSNQNLTLNDLYKMYGLDDDE